MRIERLHIEGFGHYNDHEVGPFDPALTLVRGENEAGKSTLLAFIRAVLFGFPTRLGAQHYPPLRGGRHGGRIAFRLHDGRSFTAERVQGRGRGPFQARGESGEVIDEAGFAPLIGHASESLFRSAFTFDLDDLPQFDASDGDLGGLLYGMSMGAEQLPQAMTRLDGRIDALFRPGGSTQAVAGLLRELDETDAALREVASQADDYRRSSLRRDEIAAELRQVQQQLDDLAARAQELDRRRRAWQDWTALRVLDERLAALEDTSGFPPDGAARLDRLEAGLRAAEAALDEAAHQLEEARQAAERPVPDAELLDAADAIEGLRRGREAVDASLRDLPERQAELRGREEELQRLLGELGPGWTEDRLFNSDLSIPRRGEIERWQRRLDELRAERRDRERDVEDARRAHGDAEEALRAAEAARERLSDAPDRQAVRERAERLRRLRSRHAAYDRERQRVADLEAQQREAAPVAAPPPVPGRALPVALALVGVLLVAGAIGALLGDLPVLAAALGVAGAAGLVVAGTLVAVRGRPEAPGERGENPVDSLLEQSRATLAAAENDLREATAGLIEDLDAGGLPGSAALETAEITLDRERERADERHAAEERVAGLERTAERDQRRLEEAERTRDAAQAALEESEREWSAWLAANDLPPDLAPATAAAFLNRVEVARGKAEEVRQWRHRVDAIREDIQQYRARVEPVARSLGLDTAFPDDRAAVETADAIIERFEVAREERARRNQARVTVEERARAHQRAEQTVVEARQELSSLFEAGGVTTADEFRRRAEVHEERRTIERERDDCEMRLRQVSGPDPAALDALDRALRETTLEQIEADLRATGEELQAAQTRRDALLDERGRVNTEIDQLHGDVAASEARARAAILKAELQDVARQWSSLVIARALLRRTRERYERERQPAVIQRASAFFSTLTGHRYAKFYQRIGESTVTVEDRDGSTKTPDQLSRGTREQLYLALRLGAIEEAALNHEQLPVIVDEVLVNFDPLRARRAVEAFVQLAQHTQVIVFTCHPWVADLFEEVYSKPSVIELD